MSVREVKKNIIIIYLLCLPKIYFLNKLFHIWQLNILLLFFVHCSLFTIFYLKLSNI